MTCQDFQNEFEERAGLSDAATLHFKDCADCGKLQYQQSRIWQMIQSLPRIDAPTDFNSQFRSRLAKSKASDFRPAWWKSLRYSVPVFAAVLVLTMVFASQNFFVSTPQPEELAVIQKDDEPTVLIDNAAEAKTIDSNITATNINMSSGDVNSTPKIETTPAPQSLAENRDADKKEITPKTDDDFTGSRDFGVNTAPPPILPNGISPPSDNPGTSPGEMMNPEGSNVEAMLSFLGIETVSENGKLRVTSVKPNSIPARSGLRNGDLIEAIDGKSVSGSDRIMTFRTLTILRGNQIITIVNRTQ